MTRMTGITGSTGRRRRGADDGGVGRRYDGDEGGIGLRGRLDEASDHSLSLINDK